LSTSKKKKKKRTTKPQKKPSIRILEGKKYKKTKRTGAEIRCELSVFGTEADTAGRQHARRGQAKSRDRKKKNLNAFSPKEVSVFAEAGRGGGRRGRRERWGGGERPGGKGKMVKPTKKRIKKRSGRRRGKGRRFWSKTYWGGLVDDSGPKMASTYNSGEAPSRKKRNI